MHNNPKCPNPIDHLENAIDRVFPYGFRSDSARLIALRWDEIDADAQLEYDNCEGH